MDLNLVASLWMQQPGIPVELRAQGARALGAQFLAGKLSRIQGGLVGSIFLLCVLAFPDVKQDHSRIEEVVDIIELHHCYDFRGKLAFRQLIFYKWSAYHRRFQIVDAIVVTSESMVPRRTGSGVFKSSWKDGNRKRIVKALTFRESKSSIDPEVPERQYVPIHLRQGLKTTAADHKRK